MKKGLRSTGVAVGFLGLMLGTTAGVTAVPGPELEYEWEVGTVKTVYDGDTLDAAITKSNSGYTGTQRVRTVGVQAPETAHPELGFGEQCGAAEATRFLKSVAPVGSNVQLRALKGTSFDTTNGRSRLVRSIYVQDEEGNWYDTSRELISSGRTMWFPSSDTGEQPEWAHNLEYRVLADDAAGQGRGLWTPNLCGGSPYGGANMRVWAKYWGTEEVYVENLNAYDMDLSGWKVRDAAVSGYQPGRTLPAGTVVPAGKAVKVYSGDLNLNNLPADNAAFEGDAVYLMDNAGPYGTGNLRSWFPYPCNPDNCGDPLTGQVTITEVSTSAPAMRAPSKPGSVSATASTDGSGTIVVTWAHSTDPGGPNLTYTVSATPAGGGSPVEVAGVAGTTAQVPGLSLGRSYTVAVRAVSGGGQSEAVATGTAVSPVGPPGAPTAPVAMAREGAAVVSWVPPAVTGGVDQLGYTVTAAEDATKGCTSTDGATSCVVGNLGNSASYTFMVRATNAFGSSSQVGPTAPVVPTTPPPTPSVAPGSPTAVGAWAGNGSAVVSWTAPATTGAEPITSYEVDASPGSGACVAPNGTTSCLVTGLNNGSSYTFTVKALNAIGTSASSLASNAVTPFANGTARISPATGAAPEVEPWIDGQVVAVTNPTSGVLRLGGYGLWDAQSSRYQNVENRAAYLFPASTTLGPNATLRVHLTKNVPPVKPLDSASVQRVFTGEDPFIDEGADFVEVANLNGSQVACISRGVGCRTAQVTSVPSSPVGITARSTASDVTVAWGAPISRGGLAISGYSATAYDAPVGGTAIASCSAGGGDRSCVFPASMGRAYYVEVFATNAVGSSGPSWRVRAVPKTVPSAPGSVAVSGTPGGVNVTWTPAAENGATITKYTASAYTAGTGGKPVGTCTTSNGSVLGCTIMKLQGGTQYFIDVTATNRAGNGAPSSPRTPGTPGPGGAVSTYSKGKVTVRWDAPTPGSNTITGYTAKLYTKSSGGTKVGECSAPAGKTSCTTKKMKKRSKYYIDLTMQSAAGTFTVKPRIVTGPAKKASAPKVTSATPSGKQVAIAWAPPTFNGYSYLKGYGARLYSKKKGGSVKASCSAGPSTMTCTTKALKKKGTYYSAVRVKNSKGWSKWSKRVKVVVR